MTTTNRYWPTERIDLLKKLWGEGKSATQIAGLLNVTRSSISGMAHRLGLKRNHDAALTARQRARHGLEAITPAVPPPPRVRAPKPKPVVVELPPVVPAPSRIWRPLPGCAPVPFGSPGCKWPLDGFPEPMACGRPRGDHASYCTTHKTASGSPPPTSAKQLARKLRWATAA